MTIEKITDAAGLIAFNAKLQSDSMFMIDVIQQVSFVVQHVRNVESRLNAALDALLNREVLKAFSWTGRSVSGAKLEFCKLSAFLRLFRFLGCNETLEATDELVKQFFITKLHNVTSSCETKSRKLS